MKDVTIMCRALDCHGNDGGRCRVLAKAINKKPCPFYKSKERLRVERMALTQDPINWTLYNSAKHIK